jgi:hypothetical protein
VEFGVVWHFVGLKKTSFGSLEQLVVAHRKLLPESWTNEILQHLDNFTKKTNTIFSL